MLVEAPSTAADHPKARRIEREVAPSPAGPLSLVKYVALGAQLVLLAVLVRRYNLESMAFFHLTVLTFAGFAMHYWLPMAWRLPFFLALSLAGIVQVLGVMQSVWLVGVGLGLIAICHLPISVRGRVAALLAAAGLMAAMRAGWVPTPWPFAIWPILGSMFMFRLMVYLYDLAHQTAPISPVKSLSYFFMLPNICFPLYPVIDYQGFVRNYYNDDRHRIYQTGVRWMFRGMVHLILYRIIYKDWSISLYEVENAGDFVRYSMCLFLLYLRVSGMFHVIVGMLHLFGFNLHETHHLYYLSSSFTDFWRRINIYWKDFMMKIFFYPAYFRFKRQGPLAALVLSTLLVFFLTWLLHAVQWFWLRGTFLVAANDVLFWAILAGLVVVNSIVELKRGRQRALSSSGMSWRAASAVGLRTLATFTVLCLLWSMWSSESLTAWLTLWGAASTPPTAVGWCLISGVAAAVFGGAALAARHPNGFAWSRLPFEQDAVVRCGLMVLLAAVSIMGVNKRLGKPGVWIASARNGALNPLEMAEFERGYYENLLAVNRFNSELASLYSKRPPEYSQTVLQAGVATKTNDFRRYELKPNLDATYWGAAFRTNHWGMHDKEYSKEPPPGTYRIALLGASQVMALGVEREDTFEAMLEERMNRECTGGEVKSYEILNFAVPGYFSIPQIWVLEDLALPFKPNAVFYVGHPGDVTRIVYWLVAAQRDRTPFNDPFLSALAERVGVDGETPEPLVRRRLGPCAEELLAWTYRRVVEICEAHGIRPFFVSMPMVDRAEDAENVRFAKEAGFTVLDLKGCYDGHRRQEIRLSEWDGHANALGHRLVAERLYQVIQEQKAIPLGMDADAPIGVKTTESTQSNPDS